jgi:eukaryotic-like serine/threonine-protein kinase
VTGGRTCPRCGGRYPERLSLCPRCLAEGELAPARLGDSIELVEEIGRGGMGTVWKGRHVPLNRTVAVKFLSESLAAHPEFARRFEGEAQALARLSHPGIVAVHDFGREGDRAYIVMEYVEGVPLSSRIPLPPERARDVGLQVLDALAYAHAQGVVHRDVKPDNILLEGSGRVKVSDFGVARILDPADAGDRDTTVGRVLGTPAYMAPEALTGGPPHPRMDVYSVGVVLYEAVPAAVPPPTRRR